MFSIRLLTDEPDLTPSQIEAIRMCSVGQLSDGFNRALVAYMSGYLPYATDIKEARQVFFKQIQINLENQPK